MGESCCTTCEQFAGKDVEPVERKPLEAAPATRFKIRVRARGGVPFEYVPTSDTVNIGRVAGNDITLDSSTVSKRASRITFDQGGVIVDDLKSSCGTYVDGRKITSPVKLGENAKIYIGDYTLEVIRGD